MLAGSTEWIKYRELIEGIDASIEAAWEFDADEPSQVAVADLSEVLRPVPYEELKAAGVLKESASAAIKEAARKKKVRRQTRPLRLALQKRWQRWKRWESPCLRRLSLLNLSAGSSRGSGWRRSRGHRRPRVRAPRWRP